MQKETPEGIDMSATPQPMEEFERFDTTLRNVVSIPPDELRQRKERWSLERAERKRAKSQENRT
jgi:hypothetical protein